MFKRALALLCVLLLIPAFALASRQYIIPDSDTRALTEDELWGWNYESLGYILNEIFARHGYNFIPGGQYDNFFSDRPWYSPNANSNNSAACYPKLSNLEWSNERLVKDVRADMRAQHTANYSGKDFRDYVSTDLFDVLSGFTLQSLQAGQKLPVYAAPYADAYRGANGKAVVSTNGTVYVAGWDSNWLLLMYETNKGAVRVGYVDGSKLKGTVNAPSLFYSFTQLNCQQAANLTDDPVTQSEIIRRLSAGDPVVYLSTYSNRTDWAYVETTANGQKARGFIPLSALDFSQVPGEDAGGNS